MKAEIICEIDVLVIYFTVNLTFNFQRFRKSILTHDSFTEAQKIQAIGVDIQHFLPISEKAALMLNSEINNLSLNF